MLGVNMRRSRQKALYYTITVTGSGNSSYSYLTIDGTPVTAAGSYRLKTGSVIKCYAAARRSSSTTTITLNGETAASGNPATYSYIVKKNATIALATSGSTSSRVGKVTITEE